MVGQRHAEQPSGEDDRAIGAARGHRVAQGRIPHGHQSLPAHEGEDDQGDQEQVQGMGIGGSRDAPDDRRQRQADGTCQRHGQRNVKPAQQVDRDPHGTRHEDRGQQVHPERLVAQWLQDDGRHPAHQHVGREPRRVHRAHERQHRWASAVSHAKTPGRSVVR